MRAATATLEAALEERNGWTGKPSNMIADMSTLLAQALELPPGEVERVHTASLLHDLGKLAIPDDILDNPGELNDREWRVVSEHPKIGQVVLEQAGALRDAATIVLHHHEWFDGRGYPHGLAGQEIPVGARIVAIADAYEAMVAGRPYRSAIAHEAALAELRRHAGIQFDPELVRLFVTLFADGVPWTPKENVPLHIHGHGNAVPDLLAGDHRHHGAIHDAVHARRRGEVIHPSSRSRRISTNPPKAV
jgi:HD-GYP domain-containing protein (c-di-GMP phosphodiesterase class II)